MIVVHVILFGFPHTNLSCKVPKDIIVAYDSYPLDHNDQSRIINRYIKGQEAPSWKNLIFSPLFFGFWKWVYVI